MRPKRVPYGTPVRQMAMSFLKPIVCQLTNLELTSILKQHGIAISMDGKVASATACSSSGC